MFILVLVEFEISTGGSSGEPVGSWVRESGLKGETSASNMNFGVKAYK